MHMHEPMGLIRAQLACIIVCALLYVCGVWCAMDATFDVLNSMLRVVFGGGLRRGKHGAMSGGGGGGEGAVAEAKAMMGKAVGVVKDITEKMPQAVHVTAMLSKAMPHMVVFTLIHVCVMGCGLLLALHLERLVKWMRIERLSHRLNFINRISKGDIMFAVSYSICMVGAGIVLVLLSLCSMEIPFELITALVMASVTVFLSCSMESAVSLADGNNVAANPSRGRLRRCVFLYGSMSAAVGVLVLFMPKLRAQTSPSLSATAAAAATAAAV